jgi:MoxR-like ATPase
MKESLVGNQEMAAKAGAMLEALRTETSRVLVGKRDLVDTLLTGLIAPGHVLIEGVPGIAKTLAARSLAQAAGLEYSRIQFTSDLLPADVTGTLVFNQADGRFTVRKGPVFAQLVVADEINRAPAKVQSALLEAMEEARVTIGNDTLSLPDPFFVIATQNPIEHEGTYPLPEAELDRFLVKALAVYPSEEEEKAIVSGSDERARLSAVNKVLGPGDVAFLRAQARTVAVRPELIEYATGIVRATRPEVASQSRDPRVRDYARLIEFGASPRASIALFRVARARALLSGRAYVLPDDMKAGAADVLRHRLVLSYEAEAEGMKSDDLVSLVLSTVPAP